MDGPIIKENKVPENEPNAKAEKRIPDISFS
jgi:hypothetical protein